MYNKLKNLTITTNKTKTIQINGTNAIFVGNLEPEPKSHVHTIPRVNSTRYQRGFHIDGEEKRYVIF